MDIVLMIIYATILLGFLVFIHEGGHYLAARAFGVRVTEFMLGLPGPSIGFTRGGTRFGVTAVPLGGYAKVCGMEAGEMSPHLEAVLAALYRRGTANMEDIARDCGISDDEAYDALEELVEWGSIKGPTKKDQYNTYRAVATAPTKKQIKAAAAGEPAPASYALGRGAPGGRRARVVSERVPPAVPRAAVLEALRHPRGRRVREPAVRHAAVRAHVLGDRLRGPEPEHRRVLPCQRSRRCSPCRLGFAYIGQVIALVASLFNPATAADTVSNTTSIIGIAVMSKDAVDMGLMGILSFTAMISVSLGIMNLLPIPPLDGGRFVVEVFQKVSRRVVSTRALNYLSAAGMLLFLGFFLIMANQDIQRFVFGNW